MSNLLAGLNVVVQPFRDPNAAYRIGSTLYVSEEVYEQLKQSRTHTMNPDEAAFIAAICAEPADDVARLVYADWLDEHGQPERAEFIRVQIEIARKVAGEPKGMGQMERAGFLLAMHREEHTMAAFLGDRECRCVLCLHTREREIWDGPHPPQWFPAGDPPFSIAIDGDVRAAIDPLRCAFIRRGFVDEIRCTASAWFDCAEVITKTHPVTRVLLVEFWAHGEFQRRDGSRVLVNNPGQFFTFVSEEYPRIAFDMIDPGNQVAE